MGKRLITPLVTGIVVLLIGLTLIKEGLISMGGGYQAMQDHTLQVQTTLLCHVPYLLLLLC